MHSFHNFSCRKLSKIVEYPFPPINFIQSLSTLNKNVFSHLIVSYQKRLSCLATISFNTITCKFAYNVLESMCLVISWCVHNEILTHCFQEECLCLSSLRKKKKLVKPISFSLYTCISQSGWWKIKKQTLKLISASLWLAGYC